jgi:hypothetical protein
MADYANHCNPIHLEFQASRSYCPISRMLSAISIYFYVLYSRYSAIWIL